MNPSPAAALALLALALAPAALAQTVLKGGHISPKESLEGVAADRFAALVKEKTGGALSVEMFPAEQLGKAVAQIDSTLLGNQDIYIGGNPEFERFSPGLALLGLNYAVPSQAAFRKILKSDLWKEAVIDPLDRAGLTVLASDWERGPYRVLVSTKPVRSFDDLKGLKLRIAPIDSWRRSWTALGTQVVVLAWTDVYLGLRQGTVEAVTSPITLVDAMKFAEVAKYVARTDEYWGVLLATVNKARFGRLPAAQQRALVEAAQQAGAEFVKAQEEQGAKDIEKMKREHGVTYTVIDTRPGVELMKPVIRQMEAEGAVPAGLYQKVLAFQ